MIGYKLDIWDITRRNIKLGDNLEVTFLKSKSTFCGYVTYNGVDFILKDSSGRYMKLNTLCSLRKDKKIQLRIMNPNEKEPMYNSIREELDAYYSYWNSNERFELEKIRELHDLKLEEISYYMWGILVITFCVGMFLSSLKPNSIYSFFLYIYNLSYNNSYSSNILIKKMIGIGDIIFSLLFFYLIYIMLFQLYCEFQSDEGLLKKQCLIKKKREIIEKSIYKEKN